MSVCADINGAFWGQCNVDGCTCIQYESLTGGVCEICDHAAPVHHPLKLSYCRDCTADVVGNRFECRAFEGDICGGTGRCSFCGCSVGRHLHMEKRPPGASWQPEQSSQPSQPSRLSLSSGAAPSGQPRGDSRADQAVGRAGTSPEDPLGALPGDSEAGAGGRSRSSSTSSAVAALDRPEARRRSSSVETLLTIGAPLIGKNRERDTITREHWVKDSEAPHCKQCGTAFDMILRRKHHCRCCGQVFCHRCCQYMLLLDPDSGKPDKLLGVEGRVCWGCNVQGYEGDGEGAESAADAAIRAVQEQAAQQITTLQEALKIEVERGNEAQSEAMELANTAAAIQQQVHEREAQVKQQAGLLDEAQTRQRELEGEVEALIDEVHHLRAAHLAWGMAAPAHRRQIWANGRVSAWQPVLVHASLAGITPFRAERPHPDETLTGANIASVVPLVLESGQHGFRVSAAEGPIVHTDYSLPAAQGPPEEWLDLLKGLRERWSRQDPAPPAPDAAPGPSHRDDPATQVVKCGWLHRQPWRVGQWRQRWFALVGSTLYRFHSPSAHVAKEEFQLDACEVLQCEVGGRGGWCFVVRTSTGGRGAGGTPSKEWVLEAAGPQDMAEWVRALRAAAGGRAHPAYLQGVVLPPAVGGPPPDPAEPPGHHLSPERTHRSSSGEGSGWLAMDAVGAAAMLTQNAAGTVTRATQNAVGFTQSAAGTVTRATQNAVGNVANTATATVGTVGGAVGAAASAVVDKTVARPTRGIRTSISKFFTGPEAGEEALAGAEGRAEGGFAGEAELDPSNPFGGVRGSADGSSGPAGTAAPSQPIAAAPAMPPAPSPRNPFGESPDVSGLHSPLKDDTNPFIARSSLDHDDTNPFIQAPANTAASSTDRRKSSDPIAIDPSSNPFAKDDADSTPFGTPMASPQSLDSTTSLATPNPAKSARDAMSGWLWKAPAGKMIGRWQHRYFLLKKGVVSYYDTEENAYSDGVPKGEFMVVGADVQPEPLIHHISGCCFSINPMDAGDRGKYVLEAKDKDEMMLWINTIEAAS